MLSEVLNRLEKFQGPQEASFPIDPYEFLVWWYCGYPASDVVCSKGWNSLTRDVGIDPGKLLMANPAKLAAAIKPGGMLPEPRVAISLVDLDDPYSEAQIRGRVIERRRDSDFKYIDAVSKKYVGKPWPYREGVPVALIIEPDHVHYSKQPFEHEKAA